MKQKFTTTFLILIPYLLFSQIFESQIKPEGIIFPRVNTSQRENITPIQGQCIYNTESNNVECYNGTKWIIASNNLRDLDEDTKIEVEKNTDEDIIRFTIQDEDYLQLKKNASGDLMMNLSNFNGSLNTFLGFEAGLNNISTDNQTSGYQNTFIGALAGKENTNGHFNVYVGTAAGARGNTFGNTYVGMSAGNSNDSDGTGLYNVGLGLQAGHQSSGSENIFIGAGSGGDVNGSNNILIGRGAGNLGGDITNTISNTLIIESEPLWTGATPLIHGEFNNDKLQINGSLHISEFARLIPGSAPTSPEKGTMYYDSSDDKVKVWTGSSWENLFFTSSTAETSFQQSNNSPCNSICQEDNQKLKTRVEELEQKLQKYGEVENRLEKMEQLIDHLSGSPNFVQKIEINNSARLQQNIPNPFYDNTKIKYFLPKDSKNARIKIYDATGRVVKNDEIENRGEGEIEIRLSEFSKGIYHYSLEIDGQIIDTKKMSSIK